jgi:hypothetical protein
MDAAVRKETRFNKMMLIFNCILKREDAWAFFTGEISDTAFVRRLSLV